MSRLEQVGDKRCRQAEVATIECDHALISAPACESSPTRSTDVPAARLRSPSLIRRAPEARTHAPDALPNLSSATSVASASLS